MFKPPIRRLRGKALAAGAAIALTLTGVTFTATTAQAATQGPCDIYAAGGTPCVAAHSTTRALYAAYDGPLYQVIRASDTTTKDIGVLEPGGYADAAAQDAFCAGTTCLITIIYDQSGRGNHLTQAPPGGFKGPAAGGYDNLANATKEPAKINGHKVYGVYVAAGTGYRNNNTNGIATGDQPEGMYAVFDGTHYNGACCFDYGNAETDSRDDGNGTMEAIYFGNSTGWGTGSGPGPWVMADLENGLFSGVNTRQNTGDQTVTSRFLTAIVKGEPNHWAIRAGDAQSGNLTTMWDGIRPTVSGYNPMKKQGAIILGIGGDNSNGSAGTFYEGVMTAGYPSNATEDAVQANITAQQYEAIPIPLDAGPRVSLQATTACCTSDYLKHNDSDDGVVIAPVASSSSQTDKEDATWVEAAGLANPSCISFESVNKPGYYLRHQNFKLHLQSNDGSTLFSQDATFCPKAGNSGQGVSFQSVNFPTRYLRHFNFALYIASNGGSNAFDSATSWAADTSWLTVAPWTATTTTLTWSPAAPDGDDGWYKTAPSFTLDSQPTYFVANTQYRTDGGDWTAYPGSPVTVDQQGSHQVDFYSTAKAGNVEATKTATVMVDTVAPTGTFSGTIGDVYFGSVPAAPTCTASDDTSGPVGCVVSGYSTDVGTHTLTATSTDVAGNVGTAEQTYTVLPWNLQGFSAPVDMGDVLNTVKGGKTVPLKFQVFSDTTELTDPALVTMSTKRVSCDNGAPTDEIETLSSGDTSLRYDPTAGQFIYNWKTPATPGTCYAATATTSDGSSLTALFKLH